MITYVDATLVPVRNDGQIKLYGPADFAGMRKAGRLVADCLDAVEEIIGRDVALEVDVQEMNESRIDLHLIEKREFKLVLRSAE